MIKLCSSTSFRALAKIGIILNIYLNISCKRPKHTTILLWVKKIGVYQLTKEKEKADDWIIIFDESVQVGQDRLMVILGIRQSKIDFNRPLKYQDLIPLRSIARTKWNAENISVVMEEIKSEIGNIIYFVSDCGNNLKRTTELLDIPHIPDLTHWIASILKSIYDKDLEFIELSKHLSDMKVRLNLSKVAHIMPPKQRYHSRFMNLDVIAKWAEDYIKIFDSIRKSIKTEEDELIIKELSFLDKKREFIKEIKDIMTTCNKIMKKLKNEGLNENSILSCNKYFITCKSVKYNILKNKIKEYYSMVLRRVTQKSVLITSDIIESSFGKYKNYISKNAMIGITDLALCIPAFTFQLENKDEIRQALETISVGKLKEWTKENIGKTLLTKRNNLKKSIKEGV